MIDSSPEKETHDPGNTSPPEQDKDIVSGVTRAALTGEVFTEEEQVEALRELDQALGDALKSGDELHQVTVHLAVTTLALLDELNDAKGTS